MPAPVARSPRRDLENLALGADAGLARALHDKAARGAAGAAEGRVLAQGADWRVVDVVCTSGPADRPFEEQPAWASVSLVRAGTFTCRSDAGAALLSAGAWLLVHPGQTFECAHRHGEGDRCLSFQFAPPLFEEVARDAGLTRARFTHHRLPPLRRLAPAGAHAVAAIARGTALDEVALTLAGGVIAAATGAPTAPAVAHGEARIAAALRRLEADLAAPHPLAELAAAARLSPYHFLRVFKAVTGVTPHQWLLRARLRCAAHLLATTRRPVTEIALDVGFADLSNFIRTFRAELGAAPRRYRTLAQ